MKKLEALQLLFRNDRIQEYDVILSSALDSGYQLISLRDYVNHKYNDHGRLLILRHDIDVACEGTRLMLAVERKHFARASYYFRNSTADRALIAEVEKCGSEASLHFETIADFAKANNLATSEQLETAGYMQKCLAILKQNIEDFRSAYGVSCETIASHGERLNSLLKTPNNRLTEDEETYGDLGIKLEAYNKHFIDSVVTCYISDDAISTNGGYRYGVKPQEAIARGERVILFLSHPHHWHYSPHRLLVKAIQIALEGRGHVQSFKRI